MIKGSEKFIADLEKGMISGSVHIVHQILKALKVSTDSLLYSENIE